MRKLFARKRTIVLTVVAVLALTTAAVAYWTQSGSGSGSATTGSDAAVTVNQTSTPNNLYPGGPAQGLSGNFDNPNASKAFIHSVTATVTGTNKPGCDASDFAIDGSAIVDAEVDPGNAKGAWTGLTLALVDKASNQDACKNATVSIAYTAHAA